MRAIKVKRAEKGLLGRELAALSGVPRETISRLENGHYEPSAMVLHKLADALDTSVEDLYLLEAQISAPKAPARRLAANWLEPQIGHSYLALADHEAVDVVAGLSTTEAVAELKAAIDAERDIIKSFLEHHKAEPELKAALEAAVRKHVYWLVDLEKRRRVLRGEKRTGDETLLVGMAMAE